MAISKSTHPRKPRQSKYDEVNDPAFKIPDTPENIAKAILQQPLKKWDYLTKDTKPSSTS